MINPLGDLSVNTLAQPLVRRLEQDARPLGLASHRLSNGCILIDAGVQVAGSIEAGRRITEIAMGGLARISVETSSELPRWPWRICVNSWQPVLACIGSQLAAWKFNPHESPHGYKAIGSGPARALAAKEAVFKEMGYRDQADSAILILEAESLPPIEVTAQIADACGLAPERLTLIVAPITSVAGMFQVAARILSTAMLKLHSQGLPVQQVVDLLGSVPLAPLSPNEHVAMGRANDALLYGGQVHLFVTGSDDEAHTMARQLPSSTSKAYGLPFARIYQEAEYNFYKIDTHLFAPAEVTVTALGSGNSFQAGQLNKQLLDQTFASANGIA